MLKLVQATRESQVGRRSRPPVAERVRQQPPNSRLRIQDVLRLMGESAANGDRNDPVMFEGAVEAQMREVVGRYGFERLPLTYGELMGLLEYCDALDTATGMFMFDSHAERELWRGDLGLWKEHYPHLVPAIELYAAQDLDALRRLHREQDTLAALGRTFREFAD